MKSTTTSASTSRRISVRPLNANSTCCGSCGNRSSSTGGTRGARDHLIDGDGGGFRGQPFVLLLQLVPDDVGFRAGRGRRQLLSNQSRDRRRQEVALLRHRPHRGLNRVSERSLAKADGRVGSDRDAVRHGVALWRRRPSGTAASDRRTPAAPCGTTRAPAAAPPGRPSAAEYEPHAANATTDAAVNTVATSAKVAGSSRDHSRSAPRQARALY